MFRQTKDARALGLSKAQAQLPLARTPVSPLALASPLTCTAAGACTAGTGAGAVGEMAALKIIKVSAVCLSVRARNQQPCTRIICECDALSHSVSTSIIILTGL